MIDRSMAARKVGGEWPCIFVKKLLEAEAKVVTLRRERVPLKWALSISKTQTKWAHIRMVDCERVCIEPLAPVQ